MTELYSDADILKINTQLKKRYALLGAVLAVLLALIVVSFLRRVEWVSMAAVFVFGAVAIFVIDLFCLPLRRYRKLISAARTGRSHTGVFVYQETESDISMIDGVACKGLIFLGDPDKHGSREQRFYWDSQLPVPAFRPGEEVTLRYTGRNIIGWSESRAIQ